MQRIQVDFANCYGIRHLSHVFDTAEGPAFLLYAPNGAMKSSFARVFADFAAGRQPKDSIFTDRISRSAITDEHGAPIAADRILVVEPYNQDYTSDKTATLMADQALRTGYETLVKSIQEKAEKALGTLGQAAGLRRVAIDEIGSALGMAGDVYALLDQLDTAVAAGSDPGMADVRYAEIFNDKVQQFLERADVRSQLHEYVARYNDLMSHSVYFRTGGFNHNHAANVRKVLADASFFAANHTISLAARDTDTKTEITSAEALDAAIAAEKQRIFSDSSLTGQFEAIDALITRNAELRQFRGYLERHQELIPHLADLGALRRNLWLSYAFTARVALAEFVETYHSARVAIEAVVRKATAQQTEWQRVLEIFHRRFMVPFSLEVANQPDVVLKSQAPSLIFKYHEGHEEVQVGRNELLSALSTGERRALYLLNVIFELEARKRDPEKTVLVLDDIADSFDYKNKYAIVEYLGELQETGKFAMLILTHNFDFYRTMQSRLDVGRRQNCLMATKSDTGIALVSAENLNAFTTWKRGLAGNRKLMLAAIAMARNLVEYREGTSDPAFAFLTSLLHIKPNSGTKTMQDLADVLNQVLGTHATGSADKVLDVVMQEAEGCTADGYTVLLENKVILAMASRLLAEKLMILLINDPAMTGHITRNQTRVLFNEYTRRFPHDQATIDLLDRVNLITPESIHLNSFMYEPILDMSDGHLRALYDELKVRVAGAAAAPVIV
jgi:hypothetical protein